MRKTKKTIAVCIVIVLAIMIFGCSQNPLSQNNQLVGTYWGNNEIAQVAYFRTETELEILNCESITDMSTFTHNFYWSYKLEDDIIYVGNRKWICKNDAIYELQDGKEWFLFEKLDL